MLRDKALPAASVLVFALLTASSVLPGCGAPARPGTVPRSDAAPAEETLVEETPVDEAAGDAGLHESETRLFGDEMVVMKTDKGEVRFKLFSTEAQNTCSSFVELAKEGFYDGIRFHRVVRQPRPFVVQAGDPQTTRLTVQQVRDIVTRQEQRNPLPDDPPLGMGGPGWSIKAEANDRKHVRGTLAMARAEDPDSAGSQFYICLAPQPLLDGEFTVFGEVVRGMDVVDKLELGDAIVSITVTR